jgi:glycosyltransferase involved in cell wall biosynthesis
MCNLAGELIGRNIPAQVFSFEQDNPLAQDFNRLRIPVFTTDERRLIYEDRLKLILEELARFKPSVVVANLSATSFEVLRYLPRGVVRVGTAQSYDAGAYNIFRTYAPHLDSMAAVSRTIHETLTGLPEFVRVPVHYLPYGVPMPAQVAARSAGGSDPLRILYLGRLDREQKRVHLFPQILEALRAPGIPFHWTIAGAGPEQESLRASMLSSPNQTVSFPGKVLYADVPRVLASHDVFLLASDYEGLPLSLLEAMACGVVPVVSDLPSGIREVVDETTGKRVPPAEIRGYADAIIWLHYHRDELRRFSQNAREKVRHEFSVQAMTERWLKALPAAAPQEITWPEQWKIRPILAAPNSWRFSPPFRALRRLLVRFRS